MGDFAATLKKKAGPFPIWVWALIGTIILAAYLIWRKKQTASDTTGAAADQTNSDLGSASELANLITAAGMMPYQGGDVYVNTTTNNPPPPPPDGVVSGKPPANTSPPIMKPPTGGTTTTAGPPKPSATYTVKKGDNLAAIAKKYGVSEATLWAYNTTAGVRPATTIATLKARGQNLLYTNEKILIPPKTWKPS